MSIVQNALQASIDIIDKTGFIEEHELQAVKEQCKAALSEIDKCEPVLKVTNNGSQLSLIKPNGDYWDMSKHIGEVFYTSPQPKGWVGLSNSDIKELSSNLWVAGAINRDELAKVIEAKLKQLNTKG